MARHAHTSQEVQAAFSTSATQSSPSATTQSPRPVSVLEVRNLEKVYGSRGAVTHALNGVSFDVNKGEMVAIMGPSGSGKSTLLNCIATIDLPTAGSVTIAGQNLAELSAGKMADFRRQRLGFIFQNSNLLDTLTARENIALPLTIGCVPERKICSRVEDVAERLGVSQVLDKYPYQMSGGQRQRIAACRALVTNPALVLADEPTGALDSKNAKLLLQNLEALNKQIGSTVLMVTHDAFAASYCQRALFIRDGRLYTEVDRGTDDRRAFFDHIMEVLAMIGDDDNAR